MELKKFWNYAVVILLFCEIIVLGLIVYVEGPESLDVGIGLFFIIVTASLIKTTK